MNEEREQAQYVLTWLGPEEQWAVIKSVWFNFIVGYAHDCYGSRIMRPATAQGDGMWRCKCGARLVEKRYATDTGTLPASVYRTA